MIENQPLGLPKGSIRALIVIFVVIGSIFGILIGKPDDSKYFFNLLTSTISLYIGSRLDWNKKGEL